MYIDVDHDGLARLTRDLRRAGARDLNRELVKALRRELRAEVPALRAALRATPSAGSQRTERAIATRRLGYRNAMARGVQVKVRTGRVVAASIGIDPRHFPVGQKVLPAYREGVMPRHRAPNWGRSDWHTQRSQPAFYPTLRPRIPAIQQAIEDVVKDAVNQAVGAGIL